MTIQYAIAVLQPLLINVLTRFDSLLVFSFLFAVLFLALACLQVVCGPVIKKHRSRIIPLLVVAAYAMQYTSFGNSVVFILMDAYSILQSKAGLWRQWPLALAFVWLVGATANLALIAIGYWGVRRELSRCPDYPDDETVARACSTTHITHSVKVKARKKGREVASWGILSPSILVPADFAERFTSEERYWIYLHELTHWKRRDSLRSLLLVLWRACFWFDPICRKAVQCIRHDFELACDREVVGNHGVDALEYSQLIVKTAALQRGMTLGFSSGYQNIKDRIGQLLDSGVVIGTRRRILFGVLFVAILASTLVWQHCASRATTRYIRIHNFTHLGKNGIKREFMSEIHGTYGIFGAYTDSWHTIQEIERRDLRGPDSYRPELI